jgi:hypothetical protein
MRTDAQTDGRTDRQIDIETGMTKLIVAYRNFANALEKKASLIYDSSAIQHRNNDFE